MRSADKRDVCTNKQGCPHFASRVSNQWPHDSSQVTHQSVCCHDLTHCHFDSSRVISRKQTSSLPALPPATSTLLILGLWICLPKYSTMELSACSKRLYYAGQWARYIALHGLNPKCDLFPDCPTLAKSSRMHLIPSYPSSLIYIAIPAPFHSYHQNSQTSELEK